ncbi:MAG: iron-sulfur cluster assembly scaffold protein, partial [Alphaproteobacteria bacterium]|nr:iron-sulfur cluster assembly scaffold protein [Alphaproteobacteria bacterium]
MELSDLYSQKILHIAGNIAPAPRLVGPQATSRRVSRMCGSVVEVDVNVTDGVVSGYGQEVRACALGQTSAAIMAGLAVGSTPDELRRVRTQMIAMLKANGPPPDGKWSDLKYLEPVRD